MFPKDKILRRWLIQEFGDSKLAKLPQEYDVFDSDEENKIKHRKPDYSS